MLDQCFSKLSRIKENFHSPQEPGKTGHITIKWGPQWDFGDRCRTSGEIKEILIKHALQFIIMYH